MSRGGGENAVATGFKQEGADGEGLFVVVDAEDDFFWTHAGSALSFSVTRGRSRRTGFIAGLEQTRSRKPAGWPGMLSPRGDACKRWPRFVPFSRRVDGGCSDESGKVGVYRPKSEALLSALPISFQKANRREQCPGPAMKPNRGVVREAPDAGCPRGIPDAGVRAAAKTALKAGIVCPSAKVHGAATLAKSRGADGEVARGAATANSQASLSSIFSESRRKATCVSGAC